jgi:leader peptidase (prepilin peptidase)/N-methyltransferase
MTASIAVVGVLGALVGSFLNVVVHRLPRGESLVAPGSRCTGCAAAIAPYDNVPVVSWLVLHGRCRSCDAAISPRYPIVEVLTALSFAAVAAARGVTPELLIYLPLTAALIAVAGIDIDHRIVPNRIVLPAAVWGIGASAVLRPGELPELLIAGAGAFGVLLLAALAYPGGMGMGDVKLVGVIGLYLGIAVVPALLAAFLAGSVCGLAKIVRNGARARKEAVPFAPFLAFGGLIGLIVGPELVELYATSFL